MPNPANRIQGALLALLLVPALARAADPHPVGPEFALGTCTTCRERAPAVAGTPSGAFLTAWQGVAATDARGLLARFYSVKGVPRSAERLVNKNLSSDQFDAAVAADSKNNYVVAWSEAVLGDSDILVQRFKSTGAAIGTAILVNIDDPALPKPPADYAPAVATSPDGGFTVAWIRFIPAGATTSGTDPEVWVRRFNSAGKAFSKPLKVSTGLVKGSAPDVCIPQGSGAVIVWSSLDQRRPFEASLEGISLRQLATTGALVGTFERVLLSPAADRTTTSIGCGKGGNFGIAYELDRPGVTDESDVYVQRFGKTAAAAGLPIRVNTILAGRQRTPAISYDSAGSFVVVWTSSLPDGEAVLGRRFKNAGPALSTAFTIRTVDIPSRRPTVPDLAHAGSGGGFVVVWQEGANSALGQRFIP